jgi:hypothetical protein
MKIDLFTNATMVDDAIRFLFTNKTKQEEQSDETIVNQAF